MKHFLIIIFCFFVFSCSSQTKLEETLNLMPWPKEINKATANFLINSGITISINDEDQV